VNERRQDCEFATKGTISALKQSMKDFFFRDISASVHAVESRANPRDQGIAEPLNAFTVPLLPGPQ
jgi:hypothetical protein